MLYEVSMMAMLWAQDFDIKIASSEPELKPMGKLQNWN